MFGNHYCNLDKYDRNKNGSISMVLPGFSDVQAELGLEFTVLTKIMSRVMEAE